MKKAKKDAYQIVTDKIVAMLEEGKIPWQKPWACLGAARNLSSGKHYRGINIWLLSATDYSTPWWVTFRQAKALGGSVRKGEKGQHVVFWKLLQLKDKNAPISPTGTEKGRKIPFLRYYTVFNVEQCDGITAPEEAPREEFDPVEAAEAIVEAMPQRPTIQHGGDRACYSPRLDQVRMPPRLHFESGAGYYCTLFHELTHATGHPSRVGRKELGAVAAFGSDSYSKEELVAELGASFLANECNLSRATIHNSAAYIQSWLKALKNDKKLIVHAAAAAQKAADYILDRTPVFAKA
jgi:antirestriction protein ArdC